MSGPRPTSPSKHAQWVSLTSLSKRKRETTEAALSRVRRHTHWTPGRYFLGEGWVRFVADDEGAIL